MRCTGLELQTVSAACMVAAGRLPQGHRCDFVCVGNLQPDLVLVIAWYRDLSRELAYWISTAVAPSTPTRSCLLQLASENDAPTARYGPLREAGGRCWFSSG